MVDYLLIYFYSGGLGGVGVYIPHLIYVKAKPKYCFKIHSFREIIVIILSCVAR